MYYIALGVCIFQLLRVVSMSDSNTSIPRGVMIPPVDQISAQGYDLQFAVHVLGELSLMLHNVTKTSAGHHYLFKLLLPVLQQTAKLDASSKPRVIAVSSGAHHLHNLNFDSLKDGPERRKISTESLYAQSKFGTVVWAKELGRRYGDELVSLSLNPGNVATPLQRRVVGLKRMMIVSDHIFAATYTS
jgi:retinol dehydrogenase 12